MTISNPNEYIEYTQALQGTCASKKNMSWLLSLVRSFVFSDCLIDGLPVEVFPKKLILPSAPMDFTISSNESCFVSFSLIDILILWQITYRIDNKIFTNCCSYQHLLFFTAMNTFSKSQQRRWNFARQGHYTSLEGTRDSQLVAAEFHQFHQFVQWTWHSEVAGLFSDVHGNAAGGLCWVVVGRGFWFLLFGFWF